MEQKEIDRLIKQDLFAFLVSIIMPITGLSITLVGAFLGNWIVMIGGFLFFLVPIVGIFIYAEIRDYYEQTKGEKTNE